MAHIGNCLVDDRLIIQLLAADVYSGACTNYGTKFSHFSDFVVQRTLGIGVSWLNTLSSGGLCCETVYDISCMRLFYVQEAHLGI